VHEPKALKEHALNTTNAEEQLRNYLQYGLVAEILWADEAYALNAEIVTYAKQINTHGFGALFASLQTMISDRQTLSITKMFDPVGGRYPTRSIPATLVLLEQHDTLWQVPNRQDLHHTLIESGADSTHLEQISNAELNRNVVIHFRDTLPDPLSATPGRLSLTLRTLRETRDKLIAHNEAIERTAIQESMWEETVALVNYAKNFVATIGWGYLGEFYGENSDNFWATSNAKSTSISLRRLLRAAALTEGE
jgi:hypothetical protein